MDTVTTGLIETLYSAPLQPEQWNVFLADFATHCGVTKAGLLTHDFEKNEHRILAACGDTIKDAAMTNEYQTHYWQFDKWTLHSPQLAYPGSILRGVELWPEESFLKSTFYNEFLKRVDVRELAALFACKSKCTIDTLSIFRGPSESPFDLEHLAALRSLTPHLQTALAIRRRLLALESRLADLESALDRLQTALILLDRNGQPVLANQAARHICAGPCELRLSARRIAARHPAENSRLREIIAKAISTGRGKSTEIGDAMLISRANRRPLHVFAAPFISRNSASLKRAVAIVFISDPEDRPALRSEILHKLYGLTQAESRLALALLEGKTLSEAADAHRVGYETVRSQLKNTLHKTGTTRQAEMIRLLSSLPCS